MKAVKKTLSILLSLVLCLGLVAPAFAAQVLNNENKGTFIGTDGALLAHDGKGGVAADEAEERFYDYELGEDVTLDQTLVIDNGVDASIEMNGHTLSGSGNGSVIRVNKEATLTLEDNSEDGGGTITGGTGTERQSGSNSYTYGGGIYVEGNALKNTGGELTIKDVEISGNSAYIGGGVHLCQGSKLTMEGGSISENTATKGGGIYVSNGKADLTGVTIDGNTAQLGGGVYAGDVFANNSPQFGSAVVTMEDVKITNNTATGGNSKEQWTNGGGGGIYSSSANIDLNNVTITDNKAAGCGGGLDSVGNSIVTVKDSTISGNQSGDCGGGVGVYNNVRQWNKGSFTTTNSVIAGNHAGTMGDDFASYTPVNNTYVSLNGVPSGVKADDGKDATGWYFDNADGWSNGAYPYYKYDKVKGCYSYLYLKAAHDQYFQLVDDDGNVLADVEKGTELEISKIEPPKAPEGYHFNGWSGVEDDVLIVNSGMTLTAQWAEHEWDEGAVTKAPTCAEEGETTYTCACGGTRTESIEKVGHTPAGAVRENEIPAQVGVEGSYDEVVKCSVCGEELSREGKTIPALAEPAPGFPGTSDLPDEVVELDDEDVPLAGLPIELKPEERLTRGQMIAILHWMDGSPAAQLSSFLDVAADSGFAVAIGWAQGNDIADGITESEFAPDQFVTLGQLIDFLNRYARYVGSDLVLEVEGDPGEVLTWAMAEKIINDFFTRLYA